MVVIREHGWLLVPLGVYENSSLFSLNSIVTLAGSLVLDVLAPSPGVDIHMP